MKKEAKLNLLWGNLNLPWNAPHGMIFKMKNFRNIKLKWISENRLRSCCVRLLFVALVWASIPQNIPKKPPPKQIDTSIAIIVGNISPVVRNKYARQGLKMEMFHQIPLDIFDHFVTLMPLLLQITPILWLSIYSFLQLELEMTANVCVPRAASSQMTN